MKHYRAAIIGVGKGGQGKAGVHSIGYAHANAYRQHPQFTLVGACDLIPENLAIFKERFDIAATDTDATELFKSVQPDLVSICTYVGSHRALIEQCIDAGVKAIWCEKPLALTVDESNAIQQVADAAGVRLVVNHYRRYESGFIKARELIQSGAVGQVSMIVASIQDWDLMEWGTHWLDMIRFFRGDQPVQWVMGQARCNGEKKGYGHLMEQHSMAYFCFADGSRGFLDGGVAIPGLAAIRVTGSDGHLDISVSGDLTLLNREGVQQFPAVPPASPDHGPWQLLLNDFCTWIEGGPESQLSVRNAALSTELYLAAYESAKIGDRIDLPLLSQSEFPLDAVARRQTSPITTP